MKKTIISCAVTGSIHTPSMSPHLPVTAEQIAESAIGAAEAGAAILHLHARVPDTGAPSQDPAHYAAFLPRIRAATDAIVNITTGGGLGMSMDARIAPALKTAPEPRVAQHGVLQLQHLCGRERVPRSATVGGRLPAWHP